MNPTWKPRLAPAVDLRTLPLSAEEGFVASRLDGHTTVAQLSQVTGFASDRVDAMLRRLVEAGAVTPDDAVAPAPTLPPEPAPEDPSDGAADDEAPAADAETEAAQGTHLKLYREVFHPLSADERASAAATADGDRLSALCFDPLPAVIRAVLQNPKTGPTQARLIAAHHANSAGLEWLITRADLLRDHHVQRMLFRNPQLNEGQLRRLVQHKRLLELWKWSVSREATTHARQNVSKLLRQKFSTGASEEKVELILTSEGRALGGLAGIPVDGKTAALLCARPYTSQLLVQNLAHWSTAPASLVAHLLKQPLVARQPQLRALLARHPNAPPSAKRG